MKIAASSLGVLLLGAATTVMTASPEKSEEDFNPYAASYVSRLSPPAAVHEPFRLYSGTDKVGDYYRLLEDGYDMLGYSSFESSNVPSDELRAHAEQIKADLALIYTRGVDSLVNRGKQPDASGKVDQTVYEYFATYWTRLPTPLLGLHVQRENGEDDSGLEVLAVIRQSPAALSGLQRGDVLTQLGEEELHQPEHLTRAALRYAGQTVTLAGRRDGEPFARSVTLNSR